MLEFETKIKKWGNSFGLVVPKKEIEEDNIKENEVLHVIAIRKNKGIKRTFGILKKWRSGQEIKDISSEKIPFEEGCLSTTKIWGPVIRPKKLTVKALNENGEPVKIRAKGLLARVIQHEMDHLNGVLFIDKAEKLYKIEENK